MSSYDCHRELRQRIEDIGVKYRVAVKTDQPMYVKFNQCQDQYSHFTRYACGIYNYYIF